MYVEVAWTCSRVLCSPGSVLRVQVVVGRTTRWSMFVWIWCRQCECVPLLGILDIMRVCALVGVHEVVRV